MKYTVVAMVEYTITTKADDDDDDEVEKALASMEKKLEKLGVSVGSIEHVEPME